MNILLLICGVFSFAVNSISVRAFQLKCSESKYDVNLFQSLFCLTGATAYAISGHFVYDLTGKQLLSAISFGIFFAGAVLFIASCYTCGPMSVTSVIVNSSVIIPVLYSRFSLKENITVSQTVGIILLIITFILSAFNSENKKQKRINFKWLIFVFVAFVSNGITAVIQKNYKLSAPDSDGNIFMSAAYFTAAVVLLIAFSVMKNKSEKNFVSNKRLLLSSAFVLIAGLGSFAGNGILMRLSTQLPAAILYPFVNGGICVTASVFSILFFGERLNLKKALTIIIGLSAVIVLNL